MNGVCAHIDWRHATGARLDGKRFIARTGHGQTLDGRLSLRVGVFTDTDRLMTVLTPGRHGWRLGPLVRDLLVLEEPC